MEQQLKDAARVGDVDVLCDLVCREPNVLEEIDKKPFVDTPLHEATSHDQTHFALLMIKLKPSFVMKPNKIDWFTPLHVVVHCEKTETAIQILNNHGDGGIVRVKGKGGITPLHCAAQQGNVELLLKFLYVCPKSIEDVTQQNETCFHLALKNQQLDAFKALVGWTEIGYGEAHWEEKLLSMKDDLGNTILEVATSHQLIQVVEAVLTNSRLAKYFDPRPLAVPAQQLECPVPFLNGYTHLLRIDRKLNKAAYNGESDAIYAILREDEHILDDIDKVPFANTPLHIAASKGHSRFVNEIMMLKPSFGKKLNQDGFNPLHLAIQNQEFELAGKLVHMDAELVSVKGKDGMTPLHYAIKMGNEELVAKCLKACPKSVEDVTVRNENGLHLAVKHGELACLKTLCRMLSVYSIRHYTLRLTDDQGNTPKDIADAQDNFEIIQFLRKMRAPNGINSKSIVNKLLYNVQVLLEGSLNIFGRPLHPASLEQRNIILVVCTLIAATTYQAVLSPPGGLWQADPPLFFSSVNPSNSTVPPLLKQSLIDMVGTTVLPLPLWFVFAVFNTLTFILSVAQIFHALWGSQNMLRLVLGFWVLCYSMALHIVSSASQIFSVLLVYPCFFIVKCVLDMSPTIRLLNSRNWIIWLISLFLGALVYFVFIWYF